MDISVEMFLEGTPRKSERLRLRTIPVGPQVNKAELRFHVDLPLHEVSYDPLVPVQVRRLRGSRFP